ncbi:leucine-rich repeat-containing protein 69 isoform X2 [Sciurus carolinensis]|uniref:leucine-rich repeat-containing protein 69 isoform X2 n=1 Tax=Sciurus carolinensis TaxID=30640 RepID=UPI001FB4651B|nr:leucine-rich repeat-containing protein 69 isoform X2 [Sciurus carolinensis]
MAEKLLLRAIKGGKNTHIITLSGKRIIKIPSTIEKLPDLKTLYLQNNLISKVCPEISALTQFHNLKLTEFYCEGNPLFLKQPTVALQQEDVWSLQEITSRYVMNQLAGKHPFLTRAIEQYPEVRNLISQAKKCPICGEFFLSIWLECVRFVPPPKRWKISRNLQLVPLQVLICSYKCFNRRDPDLFGIAQV